jgi:transcriptional regulator with XRE-family HTH domain
MKLGSKLKELRKKMDYSQEYVASCLEMSQANYCRIEQETLHIAPEKLEIVAQIYGISLAQLLDENLEITTSEEAIKLKENIKISVEEILKMKDIIIESLRGHIQLLEEKIKSFKS